MAIQADIPPDLTNNDKAFLFQFLNTALNSGILYALLHGIYTGILTVTLWNIFINKSWPIRRAMVVIIILLYALITINFTIKWSTICSAFIKNGRSFFTIYLKLENGAQVAYWEMGITAFMSTILADLYMIWYCWMVWGRRWFVVLLPVLFLISTTVLKIIDIYCEYIGATSKIFPTLYISFVLMMTLWCTLFIIHRILTVAGVRCGRDGRLRVYHHFIEVLVESSALYSISLILFLAFTIHDGWGVYYLDIIASIVKGIAPTLLVGRITSGHRARPDDSWQGTVVASTSIQSQSQNLNQTSSQEDRPTSALDHDLEAQREISIRELAVALRSVLTESHTHLNNDIALKSMTSSPHLGNQSLLQDSLPPSEDAICSSTLADEAAVPSR
ncbi:uncharacterized protein EV420DRAFT_1645228 [Desarmillaria tabescens]|uniref:Uncharacterized protein n=1 Tax=Armillaria tabescens TaxID=1929756 RepID=A0AA39N1G6_ARMTA|nr:uncharacterized protein EV420DRAFT_1645228 [Desarmillaria tabescens]KAK0454008.1 hypothetical protein EV420DRAFT_1645228 [Desarmillaria tabescens]